MKRRISVTTEAQADIKEATFWYENREKGLGFRLKNEVRDRAETRVGRSSVISHN